jgi:hypothetical protein
MKKILHEGEAMSADQVMDTLEYLFTSEWDFEQLCYSNKTMSLSIDARGNGGLSVSRWGEGYEFTDLHGGGMVEFMLKRDIIKKASSMEVGKKKNISVTCNDGSTLDILGIPNHGMN